jgi:CheY-like chemotaxis protein
MNLGTFQIALVEDNPGDVQLIKEIFSTLTDHADFKLFSDGQQAIDYMSQIDEHAVPHLIILDLNLPKRNGKEVLEVIKQNPRLKTIPVIMFSSSEAVNDIEKSYELQANCYIVKPFDFEEFNDVIQEIWRFWFKTATLPSTEGYAER